MFMFKSSMIYSRNMHTHYVEMRYTDLEHGIVQI